MDWKRHPVTQAYIEDLLENREGRKEEIADGKSEGNQLYIEIGRTQGVKDCIEYALREFNYVEIKEDGTESGSFPGSIEG